MEKETTMRPSEVSERVRGFVLGLCILLALTLPFSGCAQDTKTPVKQASEQQTITPTKTQQEQATQGTYLTLKWCQSPADGATMGGSDQPSLVITGNGEVQSNDKSNDLLESVNTTGTANNNAGLGKTKMGFVQINNLTITTGGTAPTATGTTSGTGSATQNPAQTTTANAELRAKGEVSAAMPVGVAAPGGMVDQQATATGRGTTSDTSKTSENQLTYSQVKAAKEQLDKLLQTLKPPAESAKPGTTTPAEIPTTQPAPTDGSGS
jgi:hypothetical protein